MPNTASSTPNSRSMSETPSVTWAGPKVAAGPGDIMPGAGLHAARRRRHQPLNGTVRILDDGDATDLGPIPGFAKHRPAGVLHLLHHLVDVIDGEIGEPVLRYAFEHRPLHFHHAADHFVA